MHFKTIAMVLMSTSLQAVQAAPQAHADSQTHQLTALVYRGPGSCSGCPESIARLLESSPSRINVTFAGPDEEVDINDKSLSNVDIYAQPGGGGINEGYAATKQYKAAIRTFVSGGGRYLGFCLGAYLAGHKPGFDLLARNDDTDEEISQHNAEVDDERDTVIQVDWDFSTGPKQCTTERKRYLYFQDGAVINLGRKSPAKVLGRYSSNGDVAASLSPFGKGWVGLIGPHPEADQEWYDDVHISNPEGVRHDIGHDFVEATMAA